MSLLVNYQSAICTVLSFWFSRNLTVCKIVWMFLIFNYLTNYYDVSGRENTKGLTVLEPKGNSSFGFLFPTLINEQLKLALGVDSGSNKYSPRKTSLTRSGCDVINPVVLTDLFPSSLIGHYETSSTPLPRPGTVSQRLQQSPSAE